MITTIPHCTFSPYSHISKILDSEFKSSQVQVPSMTESPQPGLLHVTGTACFPFPFPFPFPFSFVSLHPLKNISFISILQFVSALAAAQILNHSKETSNNVPQNAC